MSLIKRRPSPAQRAASRANSRRSTGPRSARGRATSSRNALKPRPLSSVIARAIQALGGRRRDFELAHQALAQAMQPRDAWEMAWVQDIAILRWRLQCLQRAEVGSLVVRRRRLRAELQRAAQPSPGATGLGPENMITGTEDAEAVQIRLEAELMLSGEQLDAVISCENHLEKQIDRKLRQFYGRRREPVLRQGDALPGVSTEPRPAMGAFRTGGLGCFQ